MAVFDIGEVDRAYRDCHDDAALNWLVCTDVKAPLKGRGWIVEDEFVLRQGGNAQRCESETRQNQTRAKGEGIRPYMTLHEQIPGQTYPGNGTRNPALTAEARASIYTYILRNGYP